MTAKKKKKLQAQHQNSRDSLRSSSQPHSLTQYKYIILLQPTSPLRYSDDIEKAFDQMIKEKKESLFSASMFSDLTIWKKNKNKFKPLNYDISNRKPRQKDSDYCTCQP